jgi:hypothetical protein
MASRQRGELILLTLGRQQVMVVAGDGSLSPSCLSNGDQLLWWLSNDGEGTDRSGGPRGKASRMVGSAQEAAHRRGSELGRRQGLGQDFMKSRITDALFIGENDLRRRGRGV